MYSTARTEMIQRFALRDRWGCRPGRYTTRSVVGPLLLCLVVLCPAGGSLHAQEQAPHKDLYRIQTTEGNVLIGTLVSETEKKVVLDTEQVGEVIIDRADIVIMEPIAGADTTARANPTVPADARQRKDPGRALLYSLGGTVLLTPLLVGPIVGPSFGHFYANANERAWLGIGLRSGATSLAGVAFLVDLGNASEDELSFAGVIAGGAWLGVFVSAVYDIVTARRSAREYNEVYGLNARVAPTVGPQGEQVGLALHVSF